MTFRDIRQAEEALFGGPTYSMSVRVMPPGGEDKLDDMAQAWIEGRHEEVLAYVRAREAAIRARPAEVRKPKPQKRTVDRVKLLELHQAGVPTSEIARQCGCTRYWVISIAGARRQYRTGKRDAIRTMLSEGASHESIRSALGVSERTICRAESVIAKDVAA